MSKIKGQNLRVLVNGAVVAKATNCTITITGNTEDVSTKDDVGNATSESVTSRSWQLQVETFNEVNIPTLIAAWKESTLFTLGWDQTSGDSNATPEKASFNRTGYGYLTDASFSFNDRSIISSNITFTGSGAITKVVSQ